MIHRMPRTLLLATALAFAAGSAHAQDFTFGWNPRSGDVWVDTHLTDINRYGARYRDPFIDELVRYRGAPRDLVVDLLARNWAPGDIYYACTIAQIIGRPCRYVVEEYERNHGQGWGAVAQRMGIKPGSAEFHRLKQGFAPTYERWGRPIRVDADARVQAPGKSGAARAHADGAHKGPAAAPGKGRSGHGASHDGHGAHDAKGKGNGKGGKDSDKGQGGGKGQGKGKD